MKNLLIALLLIILMLTACHVKKNNSENLKNLNTNNDTIRIANEKLEYEIIIIDAGFNSWLNSTAKPRNFYSQNYLETRNKIWVNEWNTRTMEPNRFNQNLYEMRIDYKPYIDYGYEVNYMLFNYLTFFQITNNVKLGGFSARF